MLSFAGRKIQEKDRGPWPASGVAAPVLEVRGVSKQFGGLAALQAVDLTITAGEVLGILGPNGAGKSTLINVVSGATRANSGTVLLGGENVSALDLADRARRGLVRTFQNTRPSEELTPREILRLASLAPISAHASGVAYKPDELIDLFELGPFADVRHSSLPYGFQKIVLLAATAMCRPRVLFLDEPFQGVSDSELEHVAAVIRRFQSTGAAIGLVEHNVRSVMALCKQIIVLDAGKLIFSGLAKDALRDSAVQIAYLGARYARAHG
jgi:branched-chain amino acid transport system ATP-binding protein